MYVYKRNVYLENKHTNKKKEVMTRLKYIQANRLSFSINVLIITKWALKIYISFYLSLFYVFQYSSSIDLLYLYIARFILK